MRGKQPKASMAGQTFFRFDSATGLLEVIADDFNKRMELPSLQTRKTLYIVDTGFSHTHEANTIFAPSRWTGKAG